MAKQAVIVPSIGLADMSGLRVIAHLEANGPSNMAEKIAATLQSPKAQQVAKLLMKSGTNADPKSRELAAELAKESKQTPALNGSGRLYAGASETRSANGGAAAAKRQVKHAVA